MTWHDVYLDDNLVCELVEEDEADDLAGSSGPFQLLLPQVTSEWGVPLTESKSVRRAVCALARGGRLDGKRGTATPSADKPCSTLGACGIFLGRRPCASSTCQTPQVSSWS